MVVGTTSELGEPLKEEGQEKELLEKNPGAVIAKLENTEENEDSTKTQEETETSEKTDDKEQSEEKTTEETDLDKDVDLLKKRNKDKDSFISKLKDENKNLRESLKGVKEATTTQERKEAEGKLVKTYNDQVKAYVDIGYTEKEAHAFLKPVLTLIKAGEEERLEKAREIEGQHFQAELAEFLENSNEFDQEILAVHGKAFVEELSTYNQSFLKGNLKKAAKKAYKAVIRDAADRERKVNRYKDNEERDTMIDNQKSTPAKKKADKKDDDVGRTILEADSGFNDL